ncbi:DUF882 domain-containing protein [Nitrospirillum sp. BR 11164]|uniref:YcbK family protein n=1 Tax=Nitrospirillum sp. BR 11164 TaxID=3104324 RepID=UPI002AFFF29C|nr:DUF882 domain-containing protein [Nitrospirillum sp. BR 11164]MEA1649691.1 DUF882 domain-containing protein [Nitrospirillum sp. BR 11164]
MIKPPFRFARARFTRAASLSLMLAMVAACGGGAPKPFPVPPAEADLPPANTAAIRRVVLVHPPSKEKVDVIYWHDGAYDGHAMAEVAHIMRDRHTGETHDIDPALMDFISGVILRSSLPPTTQVDILSGYRSPETNAALVKVNRNAARESFHMQGRAADIRIPALKGDAITEIAKTMQRGGAAFYDGSGHTHVDTGPVRTWATYSTR